MKEELLYFIWKYAYFDNTKLYTTQKVPLKVLQLGERNPNEGADFLFASIELKQVVWFGNIEMHLKSSDWLRHEHHKNSNYDTVILHVVWQNDLEEDVFRSDKSKIPTLELCNFVNIAIIEKYIFWKENPKNIPCAEDWQKIQYENKKNYLENILRHRLERKSGEILDFYRQNGQDLEESNFNILAKSFGFKTNAYAFEQLAKSISIKIIQKYSKQILQIEALIFGQAGFLEEAKDEYSLGLKDEYNFLKYKHNLKGISKKFWHFSPIRPANSPALRLAQFAALLQSQQIFVMDILKDSVENLKQTFTIKASPYWEKHYDFGKKSEKNWAKLGESSVEILLINTVSPMLFAYATLKNNSAFYQKSVDLLRLLRSEKNKIVGQWKVLDFEPQNAAQSQALLELYNEFCTPKKCLACPFGEHILTQK